MAQVTEKPSEERSAAILLHMLRNRSCKFTIADIERWLNQDESVAKRSVQHRMQKLVKMRSSGWSKRCMVFYRGVQHEQVQFTVG